MRIVGLRQAMQLWTLAVCLVGCQFLPGGNDPIRSAASLPKTTPWDLAALSKAPSIKWLNQKGKLRSLTYRGLPYKGKPTSVFAYYATPGTLSGDPSKDINLPAVVLVHGGGGRASGDWVVSWAKRGYAAISMDLNGCGEERLKTNSEDTVYNAPYKRLEDGGPDQSDEVKFGQFNSPDSDQWAYHAVANAILAHSLIRSFKEVDANRTAIEGLSWGGYVTLIAASLDNRFKAAVDEFGSGFLHENSYWKEWFDEKMTPEQRERWVKLWDPSMYVGSASVPLLFLTGATDKYYPIDILSKTCKLVKGPMNLSMFGTLTHEAYFRYGDPIPTEVKLFIDQHLKGGTPLPKITKVKLAVGHVLAEVVTKTKLIEPALLYTTDVGPISGRKWRLMPAKVDGYSTVSATVPDDATIWFIAVVDEREALISSEPVFAENGL